MFSLGPVKQWTLLNNEKQRNEVPEHNVSYEATDVGSWSFVGSNVPVRNVICIWLGSYW